MSHTKPTLQFGTQKAQASPTPKAIKIAYRTLMVISGLWMIIEPQFQIPEHISYEVARWTLIGTNIIYFVCNQFGWVAPNNEDDTERGGNENESQAIPT